MEIVIGLFLPWKTGFKSLGLGFGHWEWEQFVENGNVRKNLITMTSREITLKCAAICASMPIED